MSLSSMETSLCHREARDKEEESAHGTMETEKGRKRGSCLFPLPIVPWALPTVWLLGYPAGTFAEGRVVMCLHCICAMIEMWWWILSLVITCRSEEDVFQSVAQVAWKKKLFIIQFMVFSSWLGHCVPSLRIKFLVRISNVPSLKNFSNSF